MRLLHFTEFNEMVSVGELVTLRSPADMTWTLFRVGGLTDGAEKDTTATMLGSGKDHVTISRESVAAWLLKEIKDSQWKLKAPYICNTQVEQLNNDIIPLLTCTIIRSDMIDTNH